VAHVGDTRAYLAREAGCEQVTRDHTAVAEAQEALGLTDAQARAFATQHQVTRDLGRQAQTRTDWIETASSPFEVDDLLVLCSDGLHDLVPHPELLRILSQARRAGDTPDAVVDRLVGLALSRGGRDNVTVVAVKRVRKRIFEQPRYLMGAVGVLALLLGIVAGLLWARRPIGPNVEVVSIRLADATAGSLVSEGIIDLSADLAFTGSVVAAGPLEVRTVAVTHVLTGADVELRAFDVRFPPGPATWFLRVEPGARLVLQQAVLDKPDLTLDVLLVGAGSEILLRNSHVVAAGITGTAGTGSRLEVRGGRLDLKTPPPPSLEAVLVRDDAPPPPAPEPQP